MKRIPSCHIIRFLFSYFLFSSKTSKAHWWQSSAAQALLRYLPLLCKKRKEGSSAKQAVKTFWSLLCHEEKATHSLCENQTSPPTIKAKAVLKRANHGFPQTIWTQDKQKRAIWPRSGFSMEVTWSYAPPCTHRKSSLEMGPGSAKVLNLLSHWREM